MDDAHRDWLALTLVPGIGTALFIRLLARFHSAENVLRASRGALEEVVGPVLAERIAQYADVADVSGQERALEKHGAGLVTLEDPEYPLLLAEIYDPPLVLFTRGALTEADQCCVAIVGTRRATPYGIRMAERFGRELAHRGVTVVSGMAAGIDAAAHRGALEAGGRTIAVLGNGVDVVYPPQHAELMQEIIAHGCVLSQFPMGTEPSRGHFPYRNRLISGLSQGTLVVEAPIKSGALITARHAADQGREVFAVPGQVGVKNSEGPHSLIRDGAKLAETVEDILVELELPVQKTPARTEPQLAPPDKAVSADAPAASGRERAILAAVAPEGSFVDEIAAACRIPVSEALSSLTVLELKGLVRQFSGKRFAPR
ncbi:MAG: DNA-processing protein DprA [Candidatus Hydrogenedentes bacterium]|nr:DNA-processing protein DprA [Candidatus Hydrogenedentota bacterium]